MTKLKNDELTKYKMTKCQNGKFTKKQVDKKTR